MDASPLLLKIARQGLNASSSDEIVKVACAYWHEGFLPDREKIKSLAPKQQLIAAYLTEFFSAFYCVGKIRTLELVNLANEFKNQHHPVFNPNNTDDIAVEWGLDENLNAFHKDFLFYQTRHYVHDK